MTLPPEKQMENLDRAFGEMMVELDDRSIAATLFNPAKDQFRIVYATTWRELIEEGWVSEYEVEGQSSYRLTGAGWIEGLLRIGAFRDQAFTDRISRFAASLKSYVKERQRDFVLLIDDLAQEASIPIGWVFNAIESDLLRIAWGQRTATWEDRGFLVRIPLNCGVRIPDHTADIRAQFLTLTNELAIAKERLSEVTCSFCGAPIIGQGGVPISDHDEGYYVAYECGRCDTDGGRERACPSDPRFPKLEEFELIMIEDGKEPAFRWTCWPKPKTRNARLLDLHTESGATEDEAKKKIAEWYARAAKPWSR